MNNMTINKEEFKEQLANNVKSSCFHYQKLYF